MEVAQFTFWSQSPLVENEKFLVVLVGVFESEQTDILETRIVAKTATPQRSKNRLQSSWLTAENIDYNKAVSQQIINADIYLLIDLER